MSFSRNNTRSAYLPAPPDYKNNSLPHTVRGASNSRGIIPPPRARGSGPFSAASMHSSSVSSHTPRAPSSTHSRRKHYQENSFSMSDLSKVPKEIERLAQICLEPARPPIFKEATQPNLFKHSDQNKIPKLTDSGLSSFHNSDSKCFVKNQTQVELVGSISMFSPQIPYDKQNKLGGVEKPSAFLYSSKDGKISMKGADPQQLNLLNNPQYIRKAPKRKHSVIKVTSQARSQIPISELLNNSRVRQSSFQLDKSMSTHLSLTATNEFFSQNLKSEEDDSLLLGAPKKGNGRKKRADSKFGRNNTTSCNRPLGQRNMSYNTTSHRTNLMVDGCNIPGIKEEQLRSLNLAKCQDLMINCTAEQERRFFQYCRKNIRNRKLGLRELGLGPEAAGVLAGIIKNNDAFARLDIRKNQIGNEGLKRLIKGLRCNKSIVHLDLGSNDLTSEGCIAFFNMLQVHSGLTSVIFSNCEGMHRNKLGSKSCGAIAAALESNKVLTMLDVADNSLGWEGVSIICEGLVHNKNLMSLNISHNDVTRQAMPMLKAALSRSGLKELNISYTKLSDKAMEEFSVVFYNNTTKLQKLDLSYNEGISPEGILSLFQALRSNTCLKRLNLQHLQLGEKNLSRINQHLKMNKGLKWLNFSTCGLRRDDCVGIAEGLAQNTTLQSLILEQNSVLSDGANAIAEAMTKNRSLLHLDLSSCDIDEEAVDGLVKLMTRNSTLKILLLKDNKLCGNSGDRLCPAIVQNRSLTKVTLEKNSIKHKHLKEIACALSRNAQITRRNELPKIKKHLSELQSKHPLQDLQNMREDITQEIERIKKEQVNVENELRLGQELYQNILQEKNEESDQNNDEIEALKTEMSELDETLSELNERVKTSKLKGKKEIASIKFKLSNGLDSLSIVKKKMRATEREMETHRDKLDQIKKLEQILEQERREERAFKIIFENYEREVARLQKERLIQDEEIKERPASADSPSKSIKNSPKTRRPFGIGNINSQNVYFREATKIEKQAVKKSKKKKNNSVSSYDKRTDTQEGEYVPAKVKRTKTCNSVKGKKAANPPSLMMQKKKLQKMQTQKVELKKINTSVVEQETPLQKSLSS